MLDVHAPDHRMEGVRDFFLHLFTITCGLLIALGLENAAEALHHRHQRQEAESTIRQELTENRRQIDAAGASIDSETKSLVAALTFLEARQQGQPGDPNGINLSFTEGPLQDAAWRTAAATGVLSYFDYTEAENYALAYKEQELYETMQQKTLDNYLQLDSFVVRGFDPSKITKEQVDSALPVVRATIAHLRGMSDVRRGALRVYDLALR